MVPRPPFVPAWIPDWALVANSLAIEVALLVAIYVFVVRRAERKRRALAVFAVIVLVLGTLEGLAFAELGLEPRRRSAEFAFDRFPDAKEHPQKFGRFYFSWRETWVLRRASARNLVVDEQPTRGALWVDMHFGSVGKELEIRLPGGHIYEGDLVPEELWAFHDGPQDEATARALWEALSNGSLAAHDDDIARFVGKERR